MDYSNVIVRKPWGYEYLMYENSSVAVWYLFIDSGRQTSLHSHPGKKTGLILLSGEVKLSFLHDSVRLKGLSKMMIRQGLFHSTSSISEEGASIIEVESPRNKADLVRLDDKYGREGLPYEGDDAMLPMTDEHIRLSEPQGVKNASHSLCGCTLSIERFEDISALRNRGAEELIVILEGSLNTNSGDPVTSEGDVIGKKTLDRLTESFDSCSPGLLLAIQPDESLGS